MVQNQRKSMRGEAADGRVEEHAVRAVVEQPAGAQAGDKAEETAAEENKFHGQAAPRKVGFRHGAGSWLTGRCGG